MDDLMNTLILAAVASAVFPMAFLLARMCLVGLVRALPAKAPGSQVDRGRNGLVL